MDGDRLDERAFGMGRKLASGDLQLLILTLLAEQPRHGYEVIKTLRERSGGFYVPSPGMIYPALRGLADIRHADIVADGSRKRYHLSAEGRAYLEAHRAAADTLVGQLAQVERRMERVRIALRGGDRPEARTTESDGLASALDSARRELETALAAKSESSAAEQQRIAEILRRAADEIGGQT